MPDYIKAAEKIASSLHLASTPVAVAFCNDVPAGIPAYEDVVAAGCEFWEEAANRVFSTTAKDHQLCSIGVYTHNLADAPESQQEELMTTLNVMTGLDYVKEDEVAAIPVNKEQTRSVVYGPLASFPMTADVVILFAHSRQGLILTEATERVDDSIPPAMGRPACAVIPQVRNQDRAVMSLGCCGARAYLDSLTDSVALWALPAGKIEAYAEQIEILAKANEVLTGFHNLRRQDVEAGKKPSVNESLQRL